MRTEIKNAVVFDGENFRENESVFFEDGFICDGPSEKMNVIDGSGCVVQRPAKLY